MRDKVNFRRKISVLAIGLGVLAAPAPAHANDVMTINDAFALAYQFHPRLLAERATLRATDEQLAQAQALGRPTINAFGQIEASDTNYTSTPPNPFATTGSLTTKSAGVELDQPLFQGGRVTNARSRAEAQIMAGRSDLRTVEQEVLYGAAQAYLDVLSAREVVILNQKSYDVLTEEWRGASKRLELGKGTKTDVFQTRARMESSKADLIRARADLVSAEATFERTTGKRPGRLKSVSKFGDVPKDRITVLEMARSKNSNLEASRNAREAALRGVHLAKSALYPTLSAVASYNYSEGSTFDDDERERAAAGLRLTMPLYQGGARYSDIRRAMQELQAAEHSVTDAERIVKESVDSAWDNLQAAYANIVAAQAQVEATQFAFDGVRKEHRIGKRTTVDVLDAERELLDAKVAHVGANRTAALAVYSLMVITGQMTADGLSLDVNTYDPAAHTNRIRDLWAGY